MSSALFRQTVVEEYLFKVYGPTPPDIVNELAVAVNLDIDLFSASKDAESIRLLLAPFTDLIGKVFLIGSKHGDAPRDADHLKSKLARQLLKSGALPLFPSNLFDFVALISHHFPLAITTSNSFALFHSFTYIFLRFF